MNQGIVFAGVLVLVGGAVAALGDTIGRKLGKQRLRIGRLRPKHTAVVGTFLAGMFGTLLTVLVMAMFSEPVKVWLLEGDKARRELSGLQNDLKNAQGTVLQTKERLGTVSKELAGQAEKLKTAQDNVKSAQAQADEFKARAATFKDNVVAVKKDLATVKATLATTGADLKAVRERIEQAKVAQARIVGDNTAIQAQNLKLTQQNAVLEGDLANLQAQIPVLDAKIKELETAKDLLDKSYNERLKNNQADLAKANKEYQVARQELEDAKSDLESVRAQIRNLGNAQVNARTSAVIYNTGDELARVVVPEQSTEAEARNALLAALRAAETDASAKGAQASPTSTSAVGFIPFEIGNRTVSVKDQEQDVVRSLAGKRTPMVLLLHSPLNAFRGEFVWVRPTVLPDPVVYQANDLVAEGQVDGRLSQAEVAQQVLDIVNTKIRDAAVRRGMIPAVGRDMPLGQVTMEQILTIVNQVRASEKTVRVQFLAAQVTRAAEPLRLVHRLRL
ncbi:MAG: DUF3084 domain-containing protein [Fimbriimonadaceae bacterium]|nr:DUF3084 domain-containing protein [Fimbriimonadaceae bacterium]